MDVREMTVLEQATSAELIGELRRRHPATVVAYFEDRNHLLQEWFAYKGNAPMLADLLYGLASTVSDAIRKEQQGE